MGRGTTDYAGYSRDHAISAAGKRMIDGSSDPAFRGDPARWNPEELLVASIAACHQLWFLHLASVDGLAVTAYSDEPVGEMEEEGDGGGQFTRVTLRPRVTLDARHDAGDAERLAALHQAAHAHCFIARSLNFPVLCEPEATAFAR